MTLRTPSPEWENSRKVHIGGSGEADTDIETIASSDDSAEGTTFTTSHTNFEELTKEETLAWVEEQFERLGQHDAPIVSVFAYYQWC